MTKTKATNISISNGDKIGLISNLSTMLVAGIPILEAVNSLEEDAKGSQKKVLKALGEDLVQGKHIYASFSNFPNIFDKVTINVIKASEEAGSLEATLKDIKINIQREMEFTDKIKSALIYPLVIMGVFVGVLLMILIVVVPKIATVFSRLKVDLPLPTKILIFTSNLMLQHTTEMIIGLTVFIGAVYFLFKTQKALVFRFLFSLPLIRRLVKEIDLTRFSRNLHLLLTSGLPITTALELTKEVMMRKDMAKAVSEAKEMLVSGKTLSEGLRKHKGLIPSMVIKLIEVGEKSGSLDRSMQDISDYLDYQVSGTLKTLTVLIEPLMLVAVGALVGGMMLAIIAPIYGLIGQVGGR